MVEYDSELESLVKLVLAKGLATGHADSAFDLMLEVLDQYDELRVKYLCTKAAHDASK